MPPLKSLPAFFNPARQAFVAGIRDELVVAQVIVRREDTGVELRHVDDRSVDGKKLRLLDAKDIRGIAQVTSGGQFRPLKSSPNLQAGWRFIAGSEPQLESALNQLYPGAMADWFAGQSSNPPVTHYREFAARQTGMYRITAMLDDPQAARMTRVCCHPDFCLKRRLWTVPGQSADEPAAKSIIPCLEPCAILLEFARKVMRIEQEDLPAVQSTAKGGPVPENESTAVREADFDSPLNPRRRRYEIVRLEISRKPVDVGGTH